MMLKRFVDRLRGEPQLDKLKKGGLEIGKNFSYGHFCFFDPAHCFLISIGNDVTFSTRVHLLAHDASTKKHIGYAKIGRVVIKDRVFVGANTTILPGVTIGENTIIGAGSVVTSDIEDNSVYAGVPARRICSLREYINKSNKIDQRLVFGEEYTIRGGVSEENKEQMKNLLANGNIGLIK